MESNLNSVKRATIIKAMKTLFSDFFGVVVNEMMPPWFKKHCKPERALQIKLRYSNLADSGLLTFENIIAEVAKDFSLPREEIRREWLNNAKPKTRMVEFLRHYPGQVILLSNAGDGAVEMVTEKYGIGDLFDKRIISYQVKTMKPNEEIYRLAERLADNPKDGYCFVDDNQDNLVIPKKRGWQTILFKDDENTFTKLYELLD